MVNHDILEGIARVAHEANRQYRRMIAEHPGPAWDNAPEWMRSSAIHGVKEVVNNPDLTPEEAHDKWVQEKAGDGWVYGTKKDSSAKEHPCMLSYTDLPEEQRVKDYLFLSVVKALLSIHGVREALGASEGFDA